MQPLLLDHIQKIPVVHDLVKNRSQREPVVPTERGRETNDWYVILGGGGGRGVHNLVLSAFDGVRTLDARIKVREDVAIGGCGGVVCLVYDYSLQPCRIKLL